MSNVNKKKFVILIFCAFIIQIFSINSHAATSSAPALTGVVMLSGGGGGATPTASGITPGGNAVTAAGSIMPDIFSGIMSYNIPIEVPRGRKGMDPGLALTYSSGNGSGWVGVGWDLEVGAIERSAHHGVNLSGNDYILRKSGSAIELVVDPNVNGLYHAKIEGDFDRIRQLIASDGRIYWEVTDRTGVRFIYGASIVNGQAVSRQDDPLNADRIFKWCLEQVIDTNGNYMTFSYFKDNGQIYLDRIDYTGNVNDNTPTTNYVKFYRESGRTDAPNMYTTGFKVTTAYRLKSIDIFGSGNRVRAYQLTYQYSSSTGRSVISSIQQFGKDASADPTTGIITGPSALPPYTFNWQTGGTAWTTNTTGGLNPPFSVNDNCLTGDLNGDGMTDYWCETSTLGIWNVYLSSPTGYTTHSNIAGPHVSVPLSSQCFTGDLNGDGMTDFWCETASNSGQWYVYLSNLSNGTYGWTGYTWYGPAVSFPVGNLCFSGDLNGDEMTDFWCESGSNSGSWNVALSTGGGWAGWAQGSSPQPWSGLAIASPVYDQCFTGDLNGDRMTDFWCETGSNTGTWNIALSTTSGGNWAGWNTTAQWSGPKVSYSTSAPVSNLCFTGDLNGDGLTDFWCESGSGTGKWDVALATGSSWDGWTSTSSPAQWIGPATATPVYNLCFTGDINGDGMTDFWCESGSNTGSWNVGLSTGTNWTGWTSTSSPAQWTGPAPSSSRPAYQQCFTGDFNGDGKTDFWCETSSASGSWNMAVVNGNSLPDLLISIQNGLDRIISIAYTPSTQYSNSQLPFPIQTVSSVTVNDGNGNSAVTQYAYSGGFFYALEQDFRGFQDVKVTGPVGPNGEQKIVETMFHQGNDISVDDNQPNVSTGFMKGKPYRTRVMDAASGAIYTETTTNYTPTSGGSAPYFTPPYRVDIYNCLDGTTMVSCENSTSAQHIQTVYSYDLQFGNLERQDQFGDLADPTDDRTIMRSYLPNTTAWILGLPANETIYSGATGTTLVQVSSTNYYYDGTTDCNTASSKQSPDQGNLTRVVRVLDGIHDPETRMAYDNYGNVTCTRDANGNTSTLAYDATFTLPTVATTPPVGTNQSGFATTTQYYTGASTDKGLYGQVQSITDPNGAITVIEYDPFGRKTKITTPDTSWTSWSYNNFGTVGTQNIEIDTAAGLSSWAYFDGLGRTIINKKTGPAGNKIATLTHYSQTGTISWTSLPYFDGMETPRYTTFTYDAMGRVKLVNKPDGTSVQSCYANGVTVTIDADQHRKRKTNNAQGMLVKVEEYLGTYSACTTDVGSGASSPYAQTLYQYDVLGNLRFVTDAENNQTEMHYDNVGRKDYMRDPDMGYWQYGYDANGNLTSQIDANNQIISFSYDALNRVMHKHYPTTSFGPDVVYTYDETWSTNSAERLTTISMSDGSLTTQYKYDAMGRPTAVTRTIDGTSNYPIGYGYDSAGRLSSITYPDTEVVSYGYDTGNNISTVSTVINGQPTPYVSYANYNAPGQPGTVTYGNGVTTAYQYDLLNNRLSRITTLDSMSEKIINLTYSFYSGTIQTNIQSITDNIDSTRSQSFIYDELNRLQQAQSTSYGGNGILAYFYDQIGNFATKEGINYTYGPSHPHAPIATSDGNTYTYDANGNMTSDGQRTITYNYDNMPESITLSGVTANFVYDGNGKRVKKITPNGTTKYIDKLYECNDSACTKYIFAGGTRIAMKSGSDVFYYHQDHLGSTIAVTDVNGIQQLPCSNKPVMIAGPTPQYFDTIQSAYNAALDGNVIQVRAGTFTENLSLNSNISVTISGGYNCSFTTRLETSQLLGMLSDNGGSVAIDNFEIVITGSTEHKVEAALYLPFGKTVSDAGYISVNHKYTSQELDSETGLYNYNARYYNPALGKFISPDMIVPDISNPQAFNRYSYVINNPLMYTDPSGQSFWRNLFGDLFGLFLFERIEQNIQREIQKHRDSIRQYLNPIAPGLATTYVLGDIRDSFGRYREKIDDDLDRYEERMERQFKEHRAVIRGYVIHMLGDPITGGYLLQRTPEGRNILGYEIVGAATVAASLGYMKWSDVIDTAYAGYKAYRDDRDILSAVVRTLGKDLGKDMLSSGGDDSGGD
jgi:RHS repeat-associated protein